MSKLKFWNGTDHEVVGTDADKVKLKDPNNLFTAMDVEGALTELFTNVSNGKNQVATAITDKGVSANGSDTFALLASKIGQIVTGKSFATGTVSNNSSRLSFDYDNYGGTHTSPYIQVTGLGFRPSIILIVEKTYQESITFYWKDVKTAVFMSAFNSDYRSTTSYTFSDMSYIGNISITSSGFLLPVYNTYKTHSWIAFK